ncbi:MAG: electron transfer flavoprotein subunit alpha/FixB family protein, partial [Planctomycetes bacterium]|nr:electron transfer flavoprotein subunit alpha/FixB family protein [Planctomycetota bacterium]
YLIRCQADCPDDGLLARHLADAARRHKLEIVLIPATIRGRSIASQMAALLRTGLTADCTELSIGGDGLLIQTRPAFGNNLLARIVCAGVKPQMASVRPGIFPLPPDDPGRKGEIVKIIAGEIKDSPVSPEYLGGEMIQAGGISLVAADMVLAGGMGLGSAAAFVKLERLADAIGAAPAASRAAVHAGYASYSRQVGQTGVVVRPRLYLAFGISGAIQHLAGMSGSSRVAAINSDPRAAIFNNADYGLVADANQVIEALLREFSRA